MSPRKTKLTTIFIVGCFGVTFYTHCMLELLALSVGKEVYSYIRDHKAPIKIGGIVGDVSKNYKIMETQINIKPGDYKSKDQLGPSPIFQRSLIGSIGNLSSGDISKNKESRFDLKLSVPQQPIDLNKATYNLPEIATKLAGAIDPSVGAVTAACAAMLEMSLQMASEEIIDLFGISETNLTILDIFPTDYYSYDQISQKFAISPKFKTDIETYTSLLDHIKSLTEKFNELNKKYSQDRTRYLDKYGTTALVEPGRQEQNYQQKLQSYQQQEKEHNEVNSLLETELKPTMKNLISSLMLLERYNMHRISIMAVYTKPGDSCGNDWVGPFKIYVYYFLGAKATNVYSVDYCIRHKANLQKVLIRLLSNKINTNPFRFQHGGIQFMAVNDDYRPVTSINNSNIAFPIIQYGKRILSPVSDVYNWKDISMSSEDIGLAQYMFPYDLNKLEKEMLQQQYDKRGAIGQAALETVNVFTQLMKTPEIQKQMLDPKASVPAAVPAISSDKSDGVGSSVSSISSTIMGLAGAASKLIPVITDKPITSETTTSTSAPLKTIDLPDEL